MLALRSLLRQESIDVAVGVTVLPAVKLLLACRGLGLRCVVSERNYPRRARRRCPGDGCGAWPIPGLICIWCKPAQPAVGCGAIAVLSISS